MFYLRVSPHIHGCWHFESIVPFATRKSNSSSGEKLYLPVWINSDLCLSKQNRQKREKNPPASPLTACCRVEAGLVTMKTGCLPPTFLCLAPCPPHTGIQPLSLVYCHGGAEDCGWIFRSLKAAAAAADGMLPALQHIVMLKSSTLAHRNTFQPTQRCLSFVRDECAGSSPESSGGRSRAYSHFFLPKVLIMQNHICYITLLSHVSTTLYSLD